MKREVVFFFLMASSLVSRAQWQMYEVGTDKMLMDICCVTHDVIVACGEDGTIVKSVDRGEHWEQKLADESIWFFQSIKFYDELTGYAYGYQADSDGGALMRTDDGGETWSHTLYNLIDYGWSNAKLFLVDADTLYLFAGGLLWKSCNGGYRLESIEYEEYHSGIIYNWIENMYFNRNVGWMVLYNEDFGRIEVLRSTDYGTTWGMPFQVTVADEFSSFDYSYTSHIIDDNTMQLFVYTEVDGAVVYETADGFETCSEWPVEGFCSDWINYCGSHFSNNGKEGCLMGSRYDLAIAKVTFDGGYSWDDVSDGLDVAYQPVAMTGVDSVYYIATKHGRVYKMEGCHPNSVSEESDEVMLYPNPTTGELHIAAEGLSRVTVYSALGQVIYEADIQSNETVFDFSRFDEGVYLVRMNVNNGVQLRRVMVAK